MFEAYCSCEDKNILTLNTDLNDTPTEMVEGIERNFIIYNPYDTDKNIILKFKYLFDAQYNVFINKDNKIYSSNELLQGININILKNNYIKIKLIVKDEEIYNSVKNAIKTQNILSLTYSKLQITAETSIDNHLLLLKSEYKKALDFYYKKDYNTSFDLCKKILNSI